MAVAAAIPAIASVASGAFGMMQANYQARVADMNSKIAKRNAALATARGGIEAQMQDVSAAKLMGEQLAGQAASGVTLSGDSQIRTREQSRWFATADRERIIENAGMESYGYRAEAANFQAEAKANRLSGAASMVGGVLNGLGDLAGTNLGKSLLGGATGTSASTSTVAPSQQPAAFVPKPKPKPIMPTIGRSGNVYNPLLKRKLGYV